MSTHQEILAELVAKNTSELTPERLTELSATAKTLASLGPAAPPVTPKSKPDPKVAARARLAELEANPLPAQARDQQKVERAQERADLYATIHDMHGRTSSGPEAA